MIGTKQKGSSCIEPTGKKREMFSNKKYLNLRHLKVIRSKIQEYCHGNEGRRLFAKYNSSNMNKFDKNLVHLRKLKITLESCVITPLSM